MFRTSNRNFYIIFEKTDFVRSGVDSNSVTSQLYKCQLCIMVHLLYVEDKRVLKCAILYKHSSSSQCVMYCLHVQLFRISSKSILLSIFICKTDVESQCHQMPHHLRHSILLPIFLMWLVSTIVVTY